MREIRIVAYLLLPMIALGVALVLLWPIEGDSKEVLRLSGRKGETKSPIFTLEASRTYQVNFERASWEADAQPKIVIEIYRSGDDRSPVFSIQVSVERLSLAYGTVTEKLTSPPLQALPSGTYFLIVRSENVFDWEITLRPALTT